MTTFDAKGGGVLMNIITGIFCLWSQYLILILIQDLKLQIKNT